MAASKRTTFSGGSPMAQLANQAAVLENGSGAPEADPDMPIQIRPEQGPVKAAWERLKGYLAGLVAALITTMYTVSSQTLNLPLFSKSLIECALALWPPSSPPCTR